MIRTRFPAVLSAALAAACGAAAPGTTQPPGLARVGLTPEVAFLFEEDARKAAGAGADEPILVAVGAGAPGDRVQGVLRVPAAECTLLLARGSQSIDDIDLFAYGDDGTVLGADESSAKDAEFLVCPPHPKHVYVVGRIAAGHGLIAVSAQAVRPESAKAVSAALGLDAGGEGSLSSGAWPGLEEKLVAHRRSIGGTWQDDRRSTIPLDTRVPTRVSAQVEAGECLDALVVPSEEVSQVDVTVLDSEGRVVGRAASFGRDRSLIVCSPDRSVVTFELRPHAGRGIAAVLLSRSRDLDAAGASADVLRYDLVPIEPLPEQRAGHEKRLGRSFGSPRGLFEGEARVGGRVSQDVDVPQGCSRLDVVAGAPTRGIEAWLWSREGALLARGEGGSVASLFLCTDARKARLDVEAITRGGPIAAELRTAAAPAPVLQTRPLASSRLSARLWSTGALQDFTALKRAKAVRLSPAHLSSERATIAAGECVIAAAAIEAGGAAVELRARDSSTGEEIALARGTTDAAARLCAPPGAAPREATIELRVEAGDVDALFAVVPLPKS